MSAGRRLVLPPGLHRKLSRQATAAGEAECCGLLLGHGVAEAEPSLPWHRPGDTLVTRLVPTANVGRRDRRRSYRIPPRAVLEAHVRARTSGELVLGFYHSHPTGDPTPSTVDCLEAWPGYDYLIAGRAPSGCWDLRAWRLGPGSARVEVLISELEGRNAA